jgi:glycyl-tRNA synthetase beta chain
MMATKNLLVELFVEELPPKALEASWASLCRRAAGAAEGARPGDARFALTAFASPRRAGGAHHGVAAQGADKAVSQKLMPVSVGLDASGNATPALLKKLQALGADASAVPGLKRAMDGKAEALFYDSTVKGATLAEGLQKALLESLAKLPIPKVMTYQLADGWTDVKFVRPAHGLVALHGSEVVPLAGAGPAGRPHDARPSLRGSQAHGELRRCRQLCGHAGEGRRRDRRLRRAPRRDRPPAAGSRGAASAAAPNRSKTKRCSTK